MAMQYRNTGKGPIKSCQNGWVEVRPEAETESIFVWLLKWIVRAVVSVIFWGSIFAALIYLTGYFLGVDGFEVLQDEINALLSVTIIPTMRLRNKTRIAPLKSHHWTAPKPRFSVVKWAGGWVIYDRKLARPISQPCGDANDKEAPSFLANTALWEWAVDDVKQIPHPHDDYADYELDITA